MVVPRNHRLGRWRRVRARLRRWRTAEAGISSVEFALAVPILTLLVVGFADLGAVTYRKAQLAAAVRAGGQVALTQPPTAETAALVEDVVREAAPVDETGTRTVRATLRCECPDGGAIDCASACPDGARSGYVAIEVEETVPLIVPYPWLGESLRVAESATVRLY